MNIVCEINPPVGGINGRIAGAFARSDSGDIYVVNRGIFNAHGRMKKDFVRRNIRWEWMPVIDGTKKTEVIQVGSLSSTKFPGLLCDFILEVWRVKELKRNH